MAVTENNYVGDNSTVLYSFTFPYIEETDIKITLDEVATTEYTLANATQVQFNSPPGSGVKIRIYRDTDIDELKAEFFPGSAIRAQDLNVDFRQNNYAVQELSNNSWDKVTDTIQSDQAWVSSDDLIATSASQDQRFWIKPDEAITETQQNAGASTSDNVLFTSLAAARRFDTLVQTSIPTGSDWEVGKTWLQNDEEKTVSIWNGSAWVAVASGGAFTTLAKVVYVDSINGDDSLSGHRISNPKRTIKAAIEQINSETDEDGDGSVVVVAPGVYQEVAPIDILKKNVSIIGQALRSCIVHPTPATEESTLFRLNSGSYVANLTVTGMKASGPRGGNSLDPDPVYGLPTNQGWNFAFYPGATIVKSPYIANCTNFSDSEIDNSNLNAYNPAGGIGGDTDSAPTGGGILVDGSVVSSSSPLRSMVCDSYTHVGLDGPGVFVTNNGYCQATSSYAFFTHYHIKALNGGQANLAASTSDFGRYSLIADGRSPTNIFTAATVGTFSSGSLTFTISAPTADPSWHGSATRPQANMLVDVGGNTYSIISSVANGSGWDVTISRPNSANLSENLGLVNTVANGSPVSFYLRSMIASSGHTMEYVGSGTNYSALPENGGVPVEASQRVELNGGKIWAAITDEKGKFTVGDTFNVDQVTGYVNIANGAIGIPNLIQNLNLNGYTISDATGNVVIDDTLDLNNHSIVDVGSLSMDGNITLNNQADVRFADGDNSNWVALQAPITVPSNYTLTLPSNLGNTGEALITDASGNLSWSSSISTVVDRIIEGDSSVEVVDLGAGGEIRTVIDGTLATTINGTQTNILSSGSAAFPAFTVGGGTFNTGIYSPGTNQLAISTGGTERLRITSSGLVGIGTSTPSTYGAQLAVIGGSIHADRNIGGAAAQVQFSMGASSGANFGQIGNTGTRWSLGYGTTANTIGTEVLVWNSSGNVGIGTTSPSSLIHAVGTEANLILDRTGDSPYIAFRSAGTNLAGISTNGATIRFEVGSGLTERARIDSSGRLLVGTSFSPSGGQGQYARLVVQGYTGDGTAEGIFAIQRGQSSTSIPSQGDIGRIIFNDNVGNTFAGIYCYADATPGTNDHPGRLVFSTTADGASPPTERMRISSTGAIGISGANYGSSGQVLTSQGSGSAPTWSTVEGVPAGTVIYTAQSTAPTGYIKANGAAINRTTYASLFAAIGTTFGAGDGSTTFNLPDLRGEFMRGWDDGRGVDSGRAYGSAQAQAYQSHNHSVNDPGHGHSGSTGAAGNHNHPVGGGSCASGSGSTSAANSGSAYSGDAGSHAHSVTVNSNTTGISIASSGGTETRPRNVALLACIKY